METLDFIGENKNVTINALIPNTNRKAANLSAEDSIDLSCK